MLLVFFFTSNSAWFGLYNPFTHKHSWGFYALFYCTYLSYSTGDWFASYPYIDIMNVNEDDCTGDDLVWAPAEYGENPQCLVLAPPVDCQQVGWSRSNHLGNGRDGVPLNYTWTIPRFPSSQEKRIVVRIRFVYQLVYLIVTCLPHCCIIYPFV